MAKYIIRYNCGYGDKYEFVEADSLAEAEAAACEAWFESIAPEYADYFIADYSAEEWSEELAEEHDL